MSGPAQMLQNNPTGEEWKRVGRKEVKRGSTGTRAGGKSGEREVDGQAEARLSRPAGP